MVNPADNLFGIVGALMSNSVSGSKSFFENTQESNSDNSSSSTNIIIIVLVIFFVICLMLCIAVYKLTDSWFQTIACIFFGVLYLIIATMYYGFSGYKFKKVN